MKKRFGATLAVDGIDVVVPKGARFGLIGPNGAGKTTFIKLLLGICKKDEGSVVVLGGDPDDTAVRRRIGYLPERLAIPPSFSALAFLDGVARIKGIPSSRRRAEIRDTLALVGLEEVAWGRATGGYSKGMRQRTGLAAALLGQPDLLVLDEPTDGIDPLGRRQIREVILQAGRRGATIFLNSHLLAETERVCDHVAVLHKGRVVKAGALVSLRRTDAFRVVFARRLKDGPDDDDGAAARQRAVDAGFVPQPGDDGDDMWSTSFIGTDAVALSAALQAALGRGLVVVEVSPALVDLETILEQSMGADAAAASTAKEQAA
ncbi:MAG: ABC transporter ATP-binding protein [Deltaproteobacteria bacterium]|nr:ABC transporter ATP-binding protein [Deltaproteobacteria bacterium]